MVTEAVFLSDGSGFVATELARGPWDPHAQHGGAPAALMVRAFERLPAAEGLLLARVTYEFLRPVPLGALQVRAEVARSGRRAALLEGSIAGPDDVEVVRARALLVHAAQSGRVGSGDPDAARATGPPAPQAAGLPESLEWAKRPMFGSDAMEIRFTSGHFAGLGPAAAWFRLQVPLVAGETPSPLQRLAAAADFGNGISSIVPWEDHLFINPDLTVYVEREPSGEWIHLDAHTRIAPGGIGVATSTLRDQDGEVGYATQALLVAQTR